MYLERIRTIIEEQYKQYPTGCGGSFGEILCWEIHTNGLTFLRLADKWGISVTLLGELIYDHCKRLEVDPLVNHKYDTNEINITLKPPENYRLAEGEENCGNCKYKKPLNQKGLTRMWYECLRPHSVDTYNKYVCDGHKPEVGDE